MDLKVAKEAVSYYTAVTNNDWSEFYNKLDEALSSDLVSQTGDLWLIHALANEIIASGVSINEFKVNKDAIKALFDEEGRKKAGEFFTPERFAKRGRDLIEKYIPNWSQTHYAWEGSCYTMDTKVLIRRKYSSLEQFELYADSVSETICLLSKNDFAVRDINEIEYSRFLNTDWLYEDGYTLVARVTADNLKSDDEILTMRNDGKLTWSGYHNLFFKMASELIRFDLQGIDFTIPLTVTYDHKMFIKLAGDSLFRAVTALDLYEMLINNTEVYIRARSGLDIKVLGAVKVYENRDVWDLTTNNNNHCFCVGVGDIEKLDIFCGNCGSGNLFRTSGHDMSKLFLSTLQQDDVEMLKATPEFQGAHIWQLDFLSAFDFVDPLREKAFSDKLDPELRDVLENDKPLVIYMNPPYKVGMAKATEVGMQMQGTYTSDAVREETGESTLGKPAYDIFYQFCWQVMNLVDVYNLTNTYYCFFGPLTFFTGASAGVLLKEFERRFEFIDGDCISAQEFSDTSESILWGIGISLWKSRGMYTRDKESQVASFHKDILLNKLLTKPDGTIGCEGKILYEPPRVKLSNWVKPSSSWIDTSISGVRDTTLDMPIMTSHLTFKGGNAFEKTAYKVAPLRSDALGTLMVGNTLTRSSDQSAILSTPTTISYVPIVEENFWRCVGSYAFRRIYEAGWAEAKKEISAPNTSIEGYDIWLKNALVLFLFEYKSMMSSLRNISYNMEGKTGVKTIRNNLFYLSEHQVREACHDEVILKDLEDNPPTNQFMLRMIEESKDAWIPEIKNLYDWCVNYTLASYDFRKKVNYKGSLECWDAGFQQIRSGMPLNDSLSADLTKLLTTCRDRLSPNLEKFGFISEMIGGKDL